MRIGEVLGEAWSLYTRFLGRFFLTALVVFAVLDLLSALASTSGGSWWRALWALISVVVGVVGVFWVQAALVETVNDVRDGRADRSISETFETVRPVLVTATVAGIVAAIGIAIGFVLLIVPGLYLLTIWSMLIPVIVLERRSVEEAFGRSREIVRGNGWPVFGLILVIFVIVAIASLLIEAAFSPLPDFLGAWLGSLIADSLTVPFAAAALTTAYFHLVGQHEAAPAVEPTAP